MSSFKDWISAARLRTLPLSVSGIILAACFAEYNGFFNWLIFGLAILTTLSLQILSNFANDYGDGVRGTDNDERVGPKRALQSGAITSQQMYSVIKSNILIVIAFSFLLILAAFGVNHFIYTVIFFVIGGLAIYASIKYTMGDNAYGYRGLGDVFVFLFFGLVSVIGCYFLFARTVDHVVILPACIIGLLSVSVLNLNNLRDINSDRNANKETLVVKIGFQKAKIYHYTLILLAIGLCLIFSVLYYTSLHNFIYFMVFIPLLKHLKTVRNTHVPAQLDPELKKVALSTFLLALLMGVGYLL